MLVVQVIETLSTSSHIEPWAARAAGLVFAQYFWFRHCFLLTTQQGEAVQQLVVIMLSDKKLEVQDLAAASLSGGLIPMKGKRKGKVTLISNQIGSLLKVAAWSNLIPVLLQIWLWLWVWLKVMIMSGMLITVDDTLMSLSVVLTTVVMTMRVAMGIDMVENCQYP